MTWTRVEDGLPDCSIILSRSVIATVERRADRCRFIVSVLYHGLGDGWHWEPGDYHAEEDWTKVDPAKYRVVAWMPWPTVYEEDQT